ncbi:MAG TPA: PKD domain-containing protein, partial [Thermoplasmata archaeon]|nr:PKD domain-containing protein [Thermoplasmata archaeon]
WAGLLTDLDSYGGAPLGFVTPALYAAAAGPLGAKAFHDITSGSNGYSAGRGWDPVTGLGSPNGGVLAPLLTRTVVLPPTIQLTLGATPRFGAAPLTVSFNASASGGATPYAFYEVDFGDYNSSLAPGGAVRHTYPHNGTYSAWAGVFDAGSNSSVSEPVEIVVGGQPLTVALNSSNTTPLVNQSVTFGANVTGGTPPYTYNWSFGDGTFLHNGTSANVTHAYAEAAGYCVTVAVHDAANPQDGGGSNRILELVGGSLTGFCPNATAVIASLNVTPSARDLPGDFALHPSISGGIGPYSVVYRSDDPYVGLCDCGLFRTVGTHRITAFISDTTNGEATATTNVTLYPALHGTFVPTWTFGAAPLNDSFRATITGGHGPNTTTWSFGDGTSANGTIVNHTYTVPGIYVAVVDASDAFGGNASEAILIDVQSAAVGGPILTGKISPAVHVLAGTLVSFQASMAGLGGPYALSWAFSDGLSGFGSTLSETFPYTPCLVSGTCPLYANLTVTNGTGAVVLVLPIVLAHAEGGNETGLRFVSSVSPQTGNAPFTVIGSANATGLPAASVSWQFGDGGTATGSSVSHQYLANGAHTVVLTATDGGGDILMHTYAVLGSGPGPQNVVVFGGPNASSGIAPLRVTFNVTAQGGGGAPYNFTWTFGDGTPTGYGGLTNHTYLRAGTFNALVTARDPNGVSGSTDFPLSIYNGTDTNLTLNISPNIVHPSGAIRLAVAASPECTATSAPGCSAANVTVRATFSVAGATPTPVAIGGQASFPIPLNSSGLGAISMDAPANVGTYVVTVATSTRNYTGLAVEYLVVNATAPPAPVDRSVDLLAGAAVAGVIVGVVAFAALGPRRRAGHQVAPGPR